MDLSSPSFYLSVLAGIVLAWLIYRFFLKRPDSVSGREAMDMNEDHYHSPPSGDTIAAIRDKRDGVEPVKRELDPNLGGLVVSHFGGPKFNRTKREDIKPTLFTPVDPTLDLPEQPKVQKAAAVWESHRTPRQNRGFMGEYPRQPVSNTGDNLGLPLAAVLVANELGVFDTEVVQAAKEERPEPVEANVPEPREPEAPDAPDTSDSSDSD